VDAGGVVKDDLGILVLVDARHGTPGGLGTGGNDGEFLAHHGVQEGGLTHVGTAQDRHRATNEFRRGHNSAAKSEGFGITKKKTRRFSHRSTRINTDIKNNKLESI